MILSEERQAFGLAVTVPDEQLDLGRALLCIASFEYEALDLEACLARLDELAVSFSPRASGPEAAEELARYLFSEAGFRGNSQRYYDPRNSYLNEVLERRIGIPISLSALYLEVARRCGVEAHGISFPGHFLVRAGGTVLDPFHGGIRLSLADCRRRLRRVRGSDTAFRPELLDPCSPREILTRTLRNLKHIYSQEGDARRALRCTDLVLVLEPDSLQDLRDRGRLLAELSCYALAADDLEAYLARVPGALDAPTIQSQALALRARAARLN